MVMTDTHHGKAVAYPEVVPVRRAVRDIHVLAVDCYHISLHLTNHTPAQSQRHPAFNPLTVLPGDELRNSMFCHRHHWYWLISGEPVGLVIPAGIVADIIEVTEEEGHGVEPGNTGASHTYNPGYKCKGYKFSWSYPSLDDETFHSPQYKAVNTHPTALSLPGHRVG